MSVIYEPKGRALEYSELACNLYMGCTHGCKYCFAPGCMRKTAEEWHSSSHARDGVIASFRREAERLSANGETRPILFSFLSDPYQPLEKKCRLTHQALAIVWENRLHSKILTKGDSELIDADLPLMKRAGTELGITISFCNEESRKQWEPNASPLQDRIKLLKKAHGMGIRTWVSMEPVIIPDEALALIPMLAPFVDHWKVGKINHMPDVEKAIDWIGFREAAKSALETTHANYYLKKSLTELHP